MSLLEIRNLDAFYGDFQALFGFDFELQEHETVAAIGANGAGKTTLLRAITGMVEANSEVLDLSRREHPVARGRGYRRARRRHGARGSPLFPSLSVEENLIIGGYSGRPGSWSLERVYELFPALRNRRSVPGTALSGGEQQMTAIGRALMSNPDLILFDELSLGLAPVVVREIYEVLPVIKAEGTAMVVVEQDINRALEVADRVYCLQEGRLALTGAPGDLTRDRIAAAYFGT